MFIFFLLITILVIAGILFMQHPKFGARATGERLDKMQASKNFSKGVFQNRSHTPALTEGFSMWKVMYKFLFRKGPRTKPAGLIPSVKTELNTLNSGDWLVWFGHSSYFLRTSGLNILVDPVFSGNASPIPNTTKAFKGSNIYTADDMPAIDYLFISHDHYDHLDYETILKLKPKVLVVITGLGVGAHLEKWGYDPLNIIELDWDEDIMLEGGMKVYALTARHFSGRTFKRNETLWLSFLLETPERKIYIGADSGYDAHFKEIGDLQGPIDLAILENGQYNEAWKAIHFLPGENLQAAIDLNAKTVIPVHSGKFDLSLHDWDEPIKEIVRRNKEKGITLLTPRIGEPVHLNDENQVFSNWWEGVEDNVSN